MSCEYIQWHVNDLLYCSQFHYFSLKIILSIWLIPDCFWALSQVSVEKSWLDVAKSNSKNVSISCIFSYLSLVCVFQSFFYFILVFWALWWTWQVKKSGKPSVEELTFLYMSAADGVERLMAVSGFISWPDSLSVIAQVMSWFKWFKILAFPFPPPVLTTMDWFGKEFAACFTGFCLFLSKIRQSFSMLFSLFCLTKISLSLACSKELDL